MKKLIYRKTEHPDIEGMARVGFIPVGSTKTIEVYVHTDDAGKIPHFHVRKYGKNNQFEWETCIRYDSADYFLHGRYSDKLPNKKVAKELDKMFRTISTRSKNQLTHWEICVEQWNLNNSDIELDPNILQPDYTTLSI